MYDIRIVPAIRLGVFTLDSGIAEIDSIALQSVTLKLYTHDQWKPGMNALFDLRAVKRVLAEPVSDVEAMADQVAAMQTEIGSGKQAMVVTSQQLYGLGRRYSVYTEMAGRKHKSGTFYTISDALEWLGVPPDYPDIDFLNVSDG